MVQPEHSTLSSVSSRATTFPFPEREREQVTETQRERTPAHFRD